MREYQRYIKGQVWHVQRGEVYGSVEAKSRPFLIVSNDDGNGANDVLLMIPITSQPKPRMEVNVEFNVPEKGRHTILCNQITSISTAQLDYYMGTVSCGIMREVERAMCAALDMRSGKTTLKDIEYLIDELYQKHSSELEREKCTLNTNQVIECIKDRLGKLSGEAHADEKIIDKIELDLIETAKEIQDHTEGDLHIEEPCSDNAVPTKAKKTSNKRKKEQAKLALKSDGPNLEIESVITPVESVITPVDGNLQLVRRKPKGFWTEEMMLSFLVDDDSLNTKQMMEKWNIPSTKTLYSFKTIFKKKLNLNGKMEVES